NAACRRGDPPLMRARSGVVARLLLDAGADPHAIGSAGQTPLIAAAALGREEVVAELVSGGANPAFRDARGRSALVAAAFHHREAVVRQLLDFGTPVGLIEAAVLGDLSHARRLIQIGADLH